MNKPFISSQVRELTLSPEIVKRDSVGTFVKLQVYFFFFYFSVLNIKKMKENTGANYQQAQAGQLARVEPPFVFMPKP